MKTVESWCRHLTDAGTFSTATAPTKVQVENWLTMGQADVMAKLVHYGYGTAAPTDPNGLAWLEKMNCLRAVMDVEMSYPITEWGQPNARMAMFEKQWDEGVELLERGLLAGIGIAAGTATSLSNNLVFTGTSASRKLSREEEEDRVAGKFRRDFGKNNRITPAGYFDPNQP